MIISSTKYGFLKGSDVKDGDVITIKNAGEIVDSNFKDEKTDLPKKDYRFEVEVAGEMKILSMNKTSRVQLAEAWGKDTEGWVDKTALVELVKLPSGKKMISLTAVEDLNDHLTKDTPDDFKFGKGAK